MISLTRSAALAIGFATWTLAAPAIAQQPPHKLDPVAQEAQQLFVEGREAMKKGELGRAAGLFLRSQELHPTVGTLMNLATIEEQLGKISSAVAHFELATKELPEGDELLPVAKAGIARLKPRVPTLRIDRAVGAPADMSIKVEGAALAASQVGAERKLDPGSYTITTEAPGHEPRRYTVKLLEGAHDTLAVEPGKAIATASPTAQAPARTSPLASVGWAFTGLGLAGLGVGAVSGGLAIAKKGEASDACPNPAKCNVSGLEAAASGRALAGVSTAAFVLGGVGVAAGITMIIVGRDKPAKQVEQAMSIAPWASPFGAGLGASGSF